MRAPNPAQPSPAGVAARWRVLLAAALAAYAVFCWSHTIAVPGGSDSSGYLNLARDLASGRLVHSAPDLPGLGPDPRPAFAQVPLGYVPTDEGRRLVPSYPPGLPLLFAAAATVLGWTHGPPLVLVLHAVAGVVLTWLAARQAGLGRAAAALAAGAVGASPVFVLFALQAMSDVPALAWCAAALWFAGRGTTGGAAAAGAAAGMAVLVRPTNALVLLPVLVALGWSPRRWLALAAGGLPALAFLLAFNRTAYGSPFATGYGAIGGLFGWEWVPATLVHYARWLPALLSPLVLLALAAPAAFRAAPRAVATHGLWVLLGLGLYAAYFHTHEVWWYLRFALPVFPSLAILAGLAGEHLLRARPPGLRRAAAAGAALAVAGGAWFWNARFAPHRAPRGELVYVEAVRLARDHVPPGSVLVAMQASGALRHALPHRLVRWDTLDGQWPRYAAAATAGGGTVHALLLHFEEEPALGRAIRGDWTLVARAGDVALWRLRAVDRTP